MNDSNPQNGWVTEATLKQMQDYELILTNARGDELWRFFNSDDGRPQWKVWAYEPAHRAAISKWQHTKRGAAYYAGTHYIGSDYIIPRKYLLRAARLLGLELHKGPSKKLSKAQRQALIDRLGQHAQKSGSQTAEQPRHA